MLSGMKRAFLPQSKGHASYVTRITLVQSSAQIILSGWHSSSWQCFSSQRPMALP